MLESLQVKNLALIDKEEIFFGEGLNILTGETGAGKSVILGSIQLALGGKADKDMIRTGAEYALIELVFQVNERQKEQLKALDFYPEEDGTFILQRKITPSRSICKACGETVGIRQLQKIAEILIDIHGQHEHQSLLNPRKHKEILDEYVGHDSKQLQSLIREQYREYTSLQKKLSEQASDDSARLREAELLRFEIQEIEDAGLRHGEEQELETAYRKMLNAKKIRESASAMYHFTGDYHGGSEVCASENINRGLRELKGIVPLDPALEVLESQLMEIDSLLNDFNHSVSEYLQDLSFEEEDFLHVESRLELIRHLKSKYGKTTRQVMQYKDEAVQRLEILEDYENYQQKLLAQTEQLHKELLSLSEQLSKARKKAAKALGIQIIQALLELNFEAVQFEIKVNGHPDLLSSDGYDEIVFMISTNRGEEPKPLSQVASGGELSRIMLAFKTVLADKDDIQTLIFDEIDTGISGRTAWKVAEKMGFLGSDHQILCITHLPQIAAMADRHYLIRKEASSQRTVTKIRELDEEDSLRELARMLGGDQITDAALINAKEMKELAEKSKQ